VQTNIDGIHSYLIRHGHSAAGVNITRNRRANSAEAFFPNSAQELIRLLWILPFNILHLHLGGDLTPRLAALCLAVSGVPGKRSVLSFHSGGYPSSAPGRAARRASLRGFALRRFDRTIVVNEELRAVFGRYGVHPDRCRLIPPYWVPDEAPTLDPGPLADFFARHRQVILSVGLLEAEYDLPRQLEAFERLREDSVGLVWIGSGSLEKELLARIAVSPARERVLLLGDVPRTQTLAAIARSFLLWRTTLYDGDSVSVREALHYGTRVVATENGMRPAGVNTIPRADTSALIRATEDALRSPSPARLPQSGEANLRAIVDLYSEL
jgi:glycosyltransferase involved in cell wall biosynthesis